MNKLSRTLFAGVALAMPLVMLGTSPAVAANADVAVIDGSGTIIPGLGLLPAAQTISFSGNATVVGTEGTPGSVTCNFNGVDLAGSVAEGVGTVSGNCGGLDFSLCVFVREGAVVEVGCGGVIEAGAAVCVFNANDLLPTTSYTLICAAAGVNLP